MKMLRQDLASRGASRSRGNTLLVCLIVIVLLTAFAGVAFDYTTMQAHNSQRSNEMNAAYAVADGVMEKLYAQWLTCVRAAGSLAPSVNQLQNLPGSGGNYLNTNITNITTADLGMPAGAPFTVDTIRLVACDVYGSQQPASSVIDPTLPTAVGGPVYEGTTGYAAYTGYNVTYQAEVWVTSLLHGSVDANGNVTGTPVTVAVKRYFTKSLIPPLQCAAFYNNQLEIHPGGNMTVAGKVHTNNNLYACSYTGNVLNFLDNVSYTGYFNQDASGPRMMDAVDEAIYSNPQESNLSAPEFNGSSTYTSSQVERVQSMDLGGISPSMLLPANNQGTDPTTGQPLPPNYNDNSYREFVERPVASASALGANPTTTPYNQYYPTDPSAIAAQRVYNQASLKILLTKNPATGTMNVQVLGSTPSGMADGPDLSTISPGLVTAITAAINANTNPQLAGKPTPLLDWREQTTGSAAAVDVNTLDVGALKAAISTFMTDPTVGDPLNFNGILYISDITGASATGTYQDMPSTANPSGYSDVEMNASGDQIKHAVMLTDGTQLPTPTGAGQNSGSTPTFTVATDNAVYIKGDYNTGGSGSAVPTNVMPLNTQTPPPDSDFNAPGYQRVISAVMADAVGVVSNNFNPAMQSAGLWDTYQSYDPTAPYYVPPGSPLDTQLVRGATPTTVNTAIVSGYTPTSQAGAGNVSSGGLENLTRLLENWSDNNYNPLQFTYNGSLMQQFISKQFNGGWSSQNNSYQNPNRLINFDSNFLRTPPGGISPVILYTRGKWENTSDPVPVTGPPLG